MEVQGKLLPLRSVPIKQTIRFFFQRVNLGFLITLGNTYFNYIVTATSAIVQWQPWRIFSFVLPTSEIPLAGFRTDLEFRDCSVEWFDHVIHSNWWEFHWKQRATLNNICTCAYKADVVSSQLTSVSLTVRGTLKTFMHVSIKQGNQCQCWRCLYRRSLYILKLAKKSGQMRFDS